ncbi:bifunctional DNA-formamidopyrimidine glycosylase/DNA-(apurinic or apyrimidinic site) lyase [Pleionea sediminis]|uniref:bifunctional DNA-formamidopyrimidine glycosylase/DNA-(apurinic or apyrimidinic site) lyase n=1 Tax=Pleionea sediminis TaxID=2569479 RepID=UPI001184F676|nr:bifunctional DNA-formamidopyrimidine glycosylase/DNA-(apurinic or apyrimidinic site) lyase [Pleionea sediminis]
MPELPEVETARRGVKPYLENQTVKQLVIRNRKLRWPIEPELETHLSGQIIQSVTRRAKYLQINFKHGQLLVHLGMSGQLRILPVGTEPGKHDHVDLILNSHKMLRFTDPRRFGFWLWGDQEMAQKLLAKLGPEPLSDNFEPDYFVAVCKRRKASIKQVIMDNKVVVGVGNIYAAESLFRAGISPVRSANRISAKRLKLLVDSIKEVLQQAIAQGGTTLKDFLQSDGKPGYFKQKLMVYGREGQNCYQCKGIIKGTRQGQRATAYCPNCQK